MNKQISTCFKQREYCVAYATTNFKRDVAAAKYLSKLACEPVTIFEEFLLMLVIEDVPLSLRSFFVFILQVSMLPSFPNKPVQRESFPLSP